MSIWDNSNAHYPLGLRKAFVAMDNRFVQTMRKAHPELKCNAPQPVPVARAPITKRASK